MQRWLILIKLSDLNDLYDDEWFVLRWMIYTMLNGLCNVEWFVIRWIICTTLNDMYYIPTSLNDLYNIEWFVLRWMIRTTLDGLYNIESFGLQWVFTFHWVPGALIRENTVSYFTLTVELNYSCLEISRRNIFGPTPEIDHSKHI